MILFISRKQFVLADWLRTNILFMAGVGGYSYLYEPLWWAGMITSKFTSLNTSGSSCTAST